MMRPQDIKTRTFTHALRGYDRDEVRSFLHQVAESTQELQDQLTATEAEVAAATSAATTVVDSGSESAEIADEPLSDAVADAVAPPGEDQGATASRSLENDTLDAAEQVIVDRFGALGDRIADLLRHADESAAAIVSAAETDSEGLRAAAAADAAQVRSDAEEHAAQLLAEAKAIRAEVDVYRNEVTTELDAARTEQATALAEAKAAAEAEVENFRVASIEEIEKLRSDARIEVEELRSSASAEADELRSKAQVEADEAREAAIVAGREAIADHEAEAARLREDAEHDRRTAKTELDDVRTEVSSLLEQARTQSEFIKQEADEIIRTKVRANFEQAQARLDVLRNTEISSRERILRAQTELSSALTRLDAEPAPELDPASGPTVIEEAERRQAELVEGAPVADTDAGFGVDTGSETADPFVTEVVDVSEVGQATFEADVAEATQQIDAEDEGRSPLSAFLDEGPSLDAGPGEPGFAAAAYGQVDRPGSIDEAEAAGFGSTEPAVSEATEGSHDTTAGTEEASDPSSVEGSGSIGPSSLADSLPSEVAGVGGPAEEDALARLVRDAMQEAVDSARKKD